MDDDSTAPAGDRDRDSAPARHRSGWLWLAGSCVGVGVVAAVVGGLVWSLLANPPSARLRANGGVVLGETGLNLQSGVTLSFFVVGLVGGALCGVALGWRGQRFGWLTVVAVVACCGLAAWGSGWTGEHLFGPDAAEQAQHAAPGTVITFGVHVDSWVGYLGWPIGGTAAVLAVVLGWPKEQTPPAGRAPSGTVVADT